MILSAAPEVLKRLKKPGRREPSRVKIGSGPADARRKLSVKADSSLSRTLRVRRNCVFIPQLTILIGELVRRAKKTAFYIPPNGAG